MTIEQRLGRLEIELIRVRRRNGVLLIVLTLCFGSSIVGWTIRPQTLLAQPAANTLKEIRVNRLILEDDKNRMRASLDANNDLSGLIIFDEKGNPRVGVHIAKNMPALCLYDEKRNPHALLSSGKDGVGLFLSDDNGACRAVMSVETDGPKLNLLDKKRAIRAALGVNKTTTKDGKITAHPESSLLLFGSDRKVLWESP